jgi:nicotinamidase-related amidase
MNLEELASVYYGFLKENGLGDPVPLDPSKTVLVVIDAQRMMSTENYAAFFRSLGITDEAMREGLDEMNAYMGQTLGNLEAVLSACRKSGIRPIHIRIRAQLQNAADTGRLYKMIGLFCPPGDESTEFLPQAAPIDNEIILDKTCTSAHISTNIDRILRNLGVENILVAGFYTDQCVCATVRDFTDLGYRVELIEDASASFCRSRHEAALTGMVGTYCSSEKTDELLSRM